MGLIVILVGLALAVTPQQAGIIMWDKVATGMTRAEVEALYPRRAGVNYKGAESIEIKDVSVTSECKAEVNIYFENAVVSGVTLKGEGALAGRCSDTVLTALAGKYGQPMVQSERNGGLLARRGAVYVWNRGDGLTMRYKAYKDGAFGGSGLLTASWELKYTTVAATIGL